MIVETVSFVVVIPYASARCATISPEVRPFAVSESTISSNAPSGGRTWVAAGTEGAQPVPRDLHRHGANLPLWPSWSGSRCACCRPSVIRGRHSARPRRQVLSQLGQDPTLAHQLQPVQLTFSAASAANSELSPSRARITSPYYPDSRNAVKRGSVWDGYKVHFTETCDAKETGRPHLIAHVVTTDATVGDLVVVDKIHDQLDAKGLLPGEHLMDADYISAELLLTAPSQRGVRVIGPVRPMTRRTVQATGYDKASFSINWDARRAICPAGAHSRYWTEVLDNNQRSASASPPRPAPCPSRGQCNNSTCTAASATAVPPNTRPHSQPDHHTDGVRQSGSSPRGGDDARGVPPLQRPCCRASS